MNILIITSGYFPEGDAGAVRLLMIAKTLQCCGYSVTVLCRGSVGNGTIDGIEYISFRTGKGDRIGKILEYCAFPNKVKQYINTHMKSISGIYIYNAHESVFRFCERICESNSIKLYHDCVEWYSPEEYKLGKLDPSYISKNRINEKVINSSFKIIAISEYLRNYFTTKGIESIRVPIQCDSEKRKECKTKRNDKFLTVFYAGAPAKKDLVGNLFEAVLMLDEFERKRLIITIVGVNKEYLINISGIKGEIIDACGDVVKLCGRVPRSEVLKLMEEADFAFLARDAKLRYAKAGFPSKVVEALANATPMLCNISSDLGDYLVDGMNAIIAKDHTPQSICDALRRALQLTSDEKQKLSMGALRTAKEKFDYRNYVDTFKEFFDIRIER